MQFDIFMDIPFIPKIEPKMLGNKCKSGEWPPLPGTPIKLIITLKITIDIIKIIILFLF